MKKILIATKSKGKFPEIVTELVDLPFEFMNLNDIPNFPKGFEVEEPAATFEGNAIIKAMTLGKKTGLLTLAEDAGLEVDALGGRPGVYSARYGPGTDKDRYIKLLGELRHVPGEKRTAHFVAVIAIYDPESNKVRTCRGEYDGKIITEPRGINGFGYDPIFYNIELHKTNAEMSIQEKNQVSHRGKALQKAREILKKEFV
ncbi:MAG: Non-canonical purine NTP pyrophosphatase [Parcubacteria group bacterium GW2011_GWA1_38_7]|nr:MAG: Non-canonical purine NTP pyrophosphatase [Parcubacteria group bacterium GW2011_GWA1_38_7]